METQHDHGLYENCCTVIDVGHCVHFPAVVYRVNGVCGPYAAHLGSGVAEDVSSFVEFVVECCGRMIAWG